MVLQPYSAVASSEENARLQNHEDNDDLPRSLHPGQITRRIRRPASCRQGNAALSRASDVVAVTEIIIVLDARDEA